MGVFFANSYQHFTTAAQAMDKIAYTAVAPVAAAGAFGQPGTRTAQDATGEQVNFAAKTTLVVQAHLILEAQYGRLAAFYDSLAIQCTLEVRADGSLAFYRGAQSTAGGTLIDVASAAGVFQFNVQHSIRIEVVFSNTVGRVYLEVDGVAVINSAANKDTCAATTEECTHFHMWSAGSTGIALGYWSHLALADVVTDLAALQPRVSAMFATADGADETMAQTGGTGGQAWSVIEETTPDDTDYLDADPGERSSFLFGTPPANLARVLAVQSVARVFKTDADVCTARPYVTIAGTRYYGSTVAVPADVAYLVYVWDVNPATGVEWLPAAITAPIEVGWERVT